MTFNGSGRLIGWLAMLLWGLGDAGLLQPVVADDNPRQRDAHDVVLRKNVDFERHVAPLLGQLGCNTAACHGSFSGRGGFRLSLFGYSAEMDYQNLRERVDLKSPTDSLILLKPCGGTEHAGGILFQQDSSAYRTIQLWIAGGAVRKPGSGRIHRLKITPDQIIFSDRTNQPPKPVALKVQAQFADGTLEDITDLCIFNSRDEGIVTVSSDGQLTPEHSGDTSVVVSYGIAMDSVPILAPYAPAASGLSKTHQSTAECLGSPGIIDEKISEKLRLLNITASPQSGDEEFLRRLMLDTIGTIPAPDEIRSFCADASPDKREAVIDRLLAHPMHAALWASRMCDITKCDVDTMGEPPEMARRRAQMWHDWFRRRFAANTAYSSITQDILLATSREDLEIDKWIQQEAALIRQSDVNENNYADRKTLDLYWRRVSDDGRFPLKEIAELTAVAFTGVRLTCAQCHKHPFDRWTQNDYIAFKSIFSQVNYGASTELKTAIMAEIESRRKRKQQGETVESLPRVQEVYLRDGRNWQAASPEMGDAIQPRALGSIPFNPQGNLRKQFYDWLVSKQNPYFSSCFVNRVWSVYFGTGFVDPVDALSAGNPASHPALLNELADDFRKSGYDIRKLEKQILMSATYQRTSEPRGNNEADRRNFSHQQLRGLPAEVALDVLNKALGVEQDFGNDGRSGALAIEIGTNRIGGDAGRILQTFGRGERQSVCDCDRRTEPSLKQSLFLINDSSINEKIQAGSIRTLLNLQDNELVNELYLRMLSRQPSGNEREIMKKHIASAKNRESAFNDLVWAIINTREFMTNH